MNHISEKTHFENPKGILSPTFGLVIVKMELMFLVINILLFAFLLESPLYFEIGEPSHDEEQRCIDLLEILVIAPGHADHLPAQKTISIRAKKSCQRD